MQKNVASQLWHVFAFQDEGGTNPGEPVTGDAANITANVYIDGGAANAVDDTNPSELGGGYYVFTITAAESNGDSIVIEPSSATANVNVVGVPGALYTTPPNFASLSIESDGDLTEVNTLTGHTAQTGDNYARLGAPAGASVSADIAAIAADQTPKKNTALSDIPIYLVSSSDHVTPATGVSPTVEISQDGGAFAAMNGSSTITEVSDGLYQLDLVAADMNADVVVIKVTGSGADPALLTISTVD